MTPNNTLAPTFDVTVDDTSRLLVRWSDRPHREARTLSEADRQRIDEHVTALGQAEAQGHDVLPAAHRLGTALFAVMDGPDRRLARMMANSKQSGRPGRWVIRLCGARNLAQHPATHWRWELVHDGQRYLAVDDDVTVQLDSAHTSSPQVLPHRGLRVLFMAYSPEGCEPVLDYELEEDRVLGALQEALRRRRTSVVVAEDGTLAELERRLKASAHDVLHLTGHGVLTPEGPRLLMEDEEGRADLVSPEALLRVLRKGHMPALVMISSCHSAGRRGDIPSFAAELVAGGVPSVIGWVQPVRDDVATEAASHLYERLCMGDTPTQAVRHTRRVLQDLDQGNPRPSHAWATFHLLTRDAQGFVLDAQQPELSARLSGQEQTYRYLGAGGRMRVLEKGFVGRRRELQRAIRILRHGKDHDQPVAGLTILGMKGVGKSCLAARALERHVQDYTDVGLVVLHGHLDDAMMLEAFEKLALQWDDTNAQAKLGGTDDVLTRLKRLLGGIWRDRPMVIVLDDFEQNLEEQGAEGAARLKPYTADVLKMLLPICRGGAPKLMLTTTASFEPLADEERALAEVPLGPFARAATRKLWSRGVARELKNISAGAWDTLAERLGRNARVLDWARTLLAGRTPEEVAQIHQKAVDALPKWKTSEVPSSDEQKQLAETFLRTLAYDRAKALVGADALTFVKRARVYKVAVSMEALAPLADGLSVNLEHHLVALQNLGLMEVGRLDGRRAHRVSPLVEPEFKAAKSDRWHRVAADFWWSRSKDRGLSFEQLEMGWEHALAAEDEPLAVCFAKILRVTFIARGLQGLNAEYAQRHLKVLPESPMGLAWCGAAMVQLGKIAEGWKYLQQGEQLWSHRDFAADELWVLDDIGDVLYKLGRLDDAVERFEHILELRSKIHRGEPHIEIAISLNNLAGALQAQGDLVGARSRLEQSLDIYAKVHGSDNHPFAAASLHQLAQIFQVQGDIAQSRILLERSLKIQLNSLGFEEHPNVARTMMTLAGVHEEEGDLAAAQNLLERVVDINCSVFGSEHPDVVASMTALARILETRGDLASGRYLLEQSLQILIIILTTDKHRDVAAVLHKLARICKLQGDLSSARVQLERSLGILSDIHGTDEHLDAAAALQTLAEILHDQGDLKGAQRKLARALEVRTKIHRTDERLDIASSLQLMAVIRKEQGDLIGARNLIERSLQITLKIHGSDEHTSVASSLHHLAIILRAQGDLAGARRALERSIEIQVKIHGTKEHASVASSLLILGGVLRSQGDLVGAGTLFQYSLEIQLKLHGPEHPGVAVSLNRLASVFHAQGDLANAQMLLESALEIQSKIYRTDEHPYVAAALQELSGVLLAQGDLVGARERLERTLEIGVKIYGTDEHPDVAISMNSLAAVMHAGSDYNAAQRIYERSLEIQLKVYGTRDHFKTAEAEYMFATLLMDMGKSDRALQLLTHAYEVLSKQVPNHPTRVRIEELLAQYLT